ncbi:hypothetical protein Tco_0350894 [Tanacetum coccineum]
MLQHGIHVWIERFTKLKPLAFRSTATPAEAEDWITHMEKLFILLNNLKPWAYIFKHSAACSDLRVLHTNPEGMEFTYALRFRFDAINNEAEYEALIVGLKIAEQMGVENL